MERRKSIRRKDDKEGFNTSIKLELLGTLQDISENTGIPKNRLIENALKEQFKVYFNNK